jgi:cellulose synthase/poly-beta-1,6-N-acetylglucosamine synthase-like glycosyltransferase
MLTEKSYEDAPKWFHPGIGETIQEITGVKDIYFQDLEVYVIVDESRDAVSDEIEEKYDAIRVSDYTEDGILLSPNF